MQMARCWKTHETLYDCGAVSSTTSSCRGEGRTFVLSQTRSLHETFNNDPALLSYSEIEIKCSVLLVISSKMDRLGFQLKGLRLIPVRFGTATFSGAGYTIDLARTPQPRTLQEMRPFICFASSLDAAPGSRITIYQAASQQDNAS